MCHESKVIDQSLTREQVMYTTNIGTSPSLVFITYQSKHGYSVGTSSDYVTVALFKNNAAINPNEILSVFKNCFEIFREIFLELLHT